MKIWNELSPFLTNQVHSKQGPRLRGTISAIRIFVISLSLIVLLFQAEAAKAQYVADYRIPDSTYLRTHAPNKATFYAAILPGLGQIYNQKYWKVPIIYAGFGGLIYYASYNNFVYNKYKEGYEIKLRIKNGETGLEDLDNFSAYSADNLKRTKDIWRRYRDLCYIGMGILYVIQIIDADVDAYLFDYDMSEDLSMKIDPVFMPDETYTFSNTSPTALGIRCSIRF